LKKVENPSDARRATISVQIDLNHVPLKTAFLSADYFKTCKKRKCVNCGALTGFSHVFVSVGFSPPFYPAFSAVSLPPLKRFSALAPPLFDLHHSRSGLFGVLCK